MLAIKVRFLDKFLEDVKIKKIIENNQLQVDLINSEKAKKYKAFNQNIANIFKSPTLNNSKNKVIGVLGEKERSLLLEKKPVMRNSSMGNNNYKSVNPNSLNSMLNKMANGHKININALNLNKIK